MGERTRTYTWSEPVVYDASGSEIVALLTREQFEDAGYWRGQSVWVQPRRERFFETSAA